MQQPNDPKPSLSPEPTDQSAAPAPRAASEAIPRRLLFSGGLIGLLGQVACSSAEFGGPAAPKNKVDRATVKAVDPTAEASSAGQGVDSTTPAVETKDPVAKPAATPDNVCRAIDNPMIDPSQVPLAATAKIPAVVFYGSTNSALMALQLPTGDDIKQVVICTTKGKLMALHGITAADKKADGTWRPIVFDHLSLTDRGSALTEVLVLLQLSTATMKAVIQVSYMSQFQGKTVVDFGSHTVPAEMIGRQSVVQFTETAGSFNTDNTVVYPNNYNSSSVRNLQTAKSSTTWTADTNAIKGIITDIMGNVITMSGNAILEYQVFCTYVDAGNGKFVRSMLHIG